MLRERDRPRMWRAAFAVLCWAALALQYILMVGPVEGWAVVSRSLHYFSFFTILTNILVALALTGPLMDPDRRVARWTAGADVRTAIGVYILVVGLVHHFLLAPYWKPQGLAFGANLVLHYVMPAAYLLDWVWFTAKGRLKWSAPLRWLAFPLGYSAWTLAHGLTTGWWPYEFINVDALGLPRALGHFALLIALFLILGLGLTWLDRLLSATRRDTGPRPA